MLERGLASERTIYISRYRGGWQWNAVDNHPQGPGSSQSRLRGGAPGKSALWRYVRLQSSSCCVIGPTGANRKGWG